MKYIVTLFLVMMQMVSFCQADTAKPYDYAFKAWINTRGDTVKSKIFVCRKGEKRLVLTSGSYPSLSPDGKEVVYTEDDKIDSFYIYHINLIDIHTKKILKLYSGTPRKWLDARPRPIWSPNGNYLAFNSFIDNNMWSIIVLNKNDKSYRVILKGEKPFSNPSWTSDGNQVVAANEDTVYTVDLQGNINSQYAVPKELKYFHEDETSFIKLPDNENFILNANLSHMRSEGFGGYSVDYGSLYMFNVKDKTVKRLTPNISYCKNAFLTNNNTVLFSGLTEDAYSIFEYNLQSGKLEIIIEHAEYPSCRRF